MKILQISDIHWRGIARHQEYTRAFEEFFDLARRIQPDIIVNTGDTWHTKTQGITPEVINRLSWMFNQLADIAPSYTLLGNHDGNLTNNTRQDTITPIHDAVNHPSSILLDTGAYEAVNGKLCIHAYSPFNKGEAWEALQALPKNNDQVNIALYHGSMDGCMMDNGWILPEGEQRISYFAGYDFVLMGDIHKRQSLAYRLDKDDVEKPWIAYPGSFIQQSFGEEETKGCLLWDIRAKDDWDINFHSITNHQPFINVKWAGTPKDTLKALNAQRPQGLLAGSRYRIVSPTALSEHYERQMLDVLKVEHEAEDVQFKSDFIARLDEIDTGTGGMVDKKNLRKDADSVFALYKKFVDANPVVYNFSQEQIDLGKATIAGYISKLNNTTPETPTSSTWSLKYLEFDNLFGYGPNNRVDFEALSGLVGILGKNQVGKSSLIGAICYCLFNGSDRGTIKNIEMINLSSDYCQAKARFSVGGVDYVVERKTSRMYDKHKNVIPDKAVNSVNLWDVYVMDDGSEVLRSKNSVSTTDTDKEIRRLIGSQEDFLLTAFAAQEDLNKFISEGSTSRKKHLGRFLELDVFEKLHEYTKADLAKYDKAGNYITEEEWLKRTSAIQVKLDESLEKLEACTTSKASLQEKRDELMREMSAFKPDDRPRLKRELEKLEVEMGRYNKSTEKITAELQEALEGAGTALEAIEKEKVALDTYLDMESLEKAAADWKELNARLATVNGQIVIREEILTKNEERAGKLKIIPCETAYLNTCPLIQDANLASQNLGHDRMELQSLVAAKAEIMENMEKFTPRDPAGIIQQVKLIEKNIAKLTGSKETYEANVRMYNKMIAMTNEESSKTSEKLQKVQEELAVIESEYDADQDTAEKLVQTQNRVKDTERSIMAFEQEIAMHYQDIGAKNQSLIVLNKERDSGKDILQTVAVYQSLQDALSKRGIPAMVLAAQLPSINHEINKLLTTAVNFKIELDADVSSNDMNIYLIDKNGKRSIELCCGMEKSVCSIALRVALINLSSLARPNFFIIDEGFTALDDDNVQNVLSVLSLLSAYFKTVMVISHIAPIKEAVDKTIEITHNGTHSLISQHQVPKLLAINPQLRKKPRK